MKRCINCNNLLAEQDRDVCIKCMKETLKQDKTAIVKLNKEEQTK